MYMVASNKGFFETSKSVICYDRLFVTPWTVAHQAPLSMDSPGKNIEVSCSLALLNPKKEEREQN